MGGIVNKVVQVTQWGDTETTTENGGNVAYMPEPGVIRVKLSFANAGATPLYAGMVMHQDVTAVKTDNDLHTVTDFANKDNPWFNWWRRSGTGTIAISDRNLLGVVLDTPESQTRDDLDDPQVVRVCVHGVVQANCSAAVVKGNALVSSNTGVFIPAAAISNTPLLVGAVALEDAVAAETETGQSLHLTWVELQGLHGFGFNI